MRCANEFVHVGIKLIIAKEKYMNQDLKILKEEFDFLYKRIGELEWEKAISYKDRYGNSLEEIEKINKQLENYKENIEIIIERAEKYLRENDRLKKTKNKSKS